MNGSFHGRTMATLSATGNPKVQQGFEPLVAGYIHTPYGDANAVSQLMAERDDIVAVLVEPVQGEGGVIVPPAGYLEALRELCDQHDALLMLDEVQSGMGRTGKWFAFQHEDVLPDVMTLAKSLGNGVPIGACLAGPRASHIMQPGMHGSTFGGNPLACRAALAVISAIEADSLVERAATLSQKIFADFNKGLKDLPGVKEIRGKGLMIGIQLDRPCGELVARGLEAGVLINVAADSVVRLLPPLIMSDDEAGKMVSTVCRLLEAFCRDN